MSFVDKYLSRQTGDVSVTITDQMRKAAARAIEQWIVAEAVGDTAKKQYHAELDKLKTAVKQANPHWEMDLTVSKPGKAPGQTGTVEHYTHYSRDDATLDMRAAMGKVLNDLLAEEARKQNLLEGVPRPFLEATARILNADGRAERGTIRG